MHKTRILRSLLVTADNQTDISKLVAEMQACLSGASLILSPLPVKEWKNLFVATDLIDLFVSAKSKGD